jgi:hypothetical protein
LTRISRILLSDPAEYCPDVHVFCSINLSFFAGPERSTGPCPARFSSAADGWSATSSPVDL